jgi:hypothetical protein
MQNETSAWQQIWSLIRLKYYLSRRDFVRVSGKSRPSWLAWVRTMILLALAAFVSVRVYSRLSATVNSTDRAQIVSWLTLVLGSLFIYLVLAPLNVFRTGRELDIQRLLPLPLTFPTFLVARSAASLLDPEILFVLLPYLAVVAAIGVNMSPIPVALLILAFFAIAILLGQILYTVIEVAYQRRWFREMIFAFFVSLAVLVIVIVFFILGDTPEKGAILEQWQAAMTKVFSWLPGGWTAYAVGELSRGNYLAVGGVFLALVGSIGSLIWISGKGLESLYYRSGYGHVSSKRRVGGTASSRLLLLERILRRETTAVLIKEFLTFRRSPWWFLFFVTSPLFVLGAALTIPSLRHPSVTVLLAFAAGGAIEILQGMNFLATEGQALPVLLTLPAPRRALLVGKNLRLLVTVFVEMTIDLTLYAIVVDRLRYLPAMLLFNLSTDLVVLAVLAAISVLDPQRVGKFEFLPRMRMRSLLACILCSAVGGSPIFALIWLGGRDPGLLTVACVLSLAYGLLFYRLGVTLVSTHLERKEKDILAALA